MSNLEQIHTRLKTSRIAAGYKTATEFCETNHIPLSTYNMHETGRRKIMPTVADRYAQLLQVNTAWLITGQGSPYLESRRQSEIITSEEFIHLLSYQGNKRIKTKETKINQPSPAINKALFCTIFNAVVDALDEHYSDIDNIVSFSTEIYQDITHTSHEPTQQQAMIALAITILKKNFSTKI